MDYPESLVQRQIVQLSDLDTDMGPSSPPPNDKLHNRPPPRGPPSRWANRGTIHTVDLADLVSPSGASGRWAVGVRTDQAIKITLQMWICFGISQNTERSYLFMNTITAHVNPMSSQATTVNPNGKACILRLSTEKAFQCYLINYVMKSKSWILEIFNLSLTTYVKRFYEFTTRRLRSLC